MARPEARSSPSPKLTQRPPASTGRRQQCYSARVTDESEKEARLARAQARAARLTMEVVPLGTPKPSPYAHASPEERLAAATRLIGFHAALQNRTSSPLPRSAWPGEAFKCSPRHG
jgi:hypothetical protein